MEFPDRESERIARYEHVGRPAIQRACTAVFVRAAQATGRDKIDSRTKSLRKMHR